MSDLTRRTFMATTGMAVGMGRMASAAEPESPTEGKTPDMPANASIRDLVWKTPLVDTHEHLWEESVRVKAVKHRSLKVPAPDFGMLMMHYTDSDLQVSGMPGDDFDALTKYGKEPRDKWKLVAPYYARCRNTGYQQCVRESVRLLFGEDDIREDNCESISEKLAAGVQPGFYRRVLKEVANIEYTQVNNLETPVFMETEQPDLLCQDISTVGLATSPNIKAISRLAGREVGSLNDWLAVIDWCFDTYGPRAIATKNQSAYERRLNYDRVAKEDAAPLFDRYLKDAQSVSAEERKAIQDCLFHYCVEKAVEYRLPVKLHTGYYAGHDRMPLERLRQNAGDLCPVVAAHPKAQFVLMHIDYPYQDEVIAMAKNYTNVYVDMCWAWIINPLASVRFLKEFLMAAPVCKVLTFGGDYRPVEMVPGHAQVARKGIAQAFTELLAAGWVEEKDVPLYIDRVMRGNAHELFDYEGKLKNWKGR